MQTAQEQTKQSGRLSAKRDTAFNCKTLTSISPVIHLSNKRYIKCKHNISKIEFLSEFQKVEGI